MTAVWRELQVAYWWNISSNSLNRKAVRWTSNKHSFPNILSCTLHSCFERNVFESEGHFRRLRVRRRSGKGWIEITPVTFDSWEGVSTEIYLSHLMWHAHILQGWKFTRIAPTSYSVSFSYNVQIKHVLVESTVLHVNLSMYIVHIIYLLYLVLTSLWICFPLKISKNFQSRKKNCAR